MARVAILMCGSSEVSWGKLASSIGALAMQHERQNPGQQGNVDA